MKKNLSSIVAIILVVSLFAFAGAKAYDAFQGVTMNDVTFENAFFGMTSGDKMAGDVFGADGDSNFTNLVAEGDITAGDDLTVGGDLALTGTFDAGSGMVYDVESITATTTLTSASGNFIVFPASADQITVTLPASTTVGAVYTFVVTGALTGPSVTIKSAEVSNIEGILMVNDADVACSNEDQLNIVTDGEVIGDRVQLMSDGTSWIILDSDIDAAGKMTCTT